MNTKKCVVLIGFVVIFVLIGLNVIPASAEELIYEVKFSVDDLSFETLNGYDTVNLPDCVFTREVGKPQLSYKVLHFAIDEDKEVYEVELITDIQREIPGEFNIYPAQKSVRIGEEREFTLPDPSIYNSFEGYPKQRVEIKAEGSLSGVKIATLHVYPFEYIPVEKKLILHTEMRLRIVQQSSSPEAGVAPSAPSVGRRTVQGNDTIKSMLERIVVNPEDIEEQFTQPAEGIYSSSGELIDYLIITSEELENSGVFQPLIDSKVARGLSVAVESVQDIEISYPGRDTQEQIRNAIKDKWANNGLVWVLLGGDTDIVPVRIVDPAYPEELVVYPGYCDDPRCDMYYSDLDGDWDANGNDIFGEFADNIDMYPDVFVGRASVEDETETRVFVDKVLTYQSNVPYYANTALFLGCDDYEDAGGKTKDFIDQEYMPPKFDPITKYYERDIPVYRDLTIRAPNQGYHLINHIDHAWINALATGADCLYTAHIDGLTNASTPSILWSCGCWPAAIDYDCIAEHWVTNPQGGGVAFVGNSRFGLNPESDQMLDPEFFKSLFIEGFTQIGQTLADSKITFIGQAESDLDMRYAMFELNLLGDPEMTIQLEVAKNLISITSPSHQDWIRGEIDVLGSTSPFGDDIFERYELCYAPEDNPEDTTLITSSSSPVQEGLLGVWDTTQCPDGKYILILKVTFISKDREFTRSIDVNIDNINQPPEFVAPLYNKGAIIDKLLEFKVEAKDLDEPGTPWAELTYSANWAEFDPDTQIFSWRPGKRDAYQVTFAVHDSEHTVTKDIVLTTEVALDETRLVLVGAYGRTPLDIYGDKIVWAEMGNTFLYNILTSQRTQITCPGYAMYPAIYQDKIVWFAEDDIYMCTYDSSTGKVGPVVPICTELHDQLFPAIYEDKIVWQDNRNGIFWPDIYMYDLNKALEIRITDHSSFQGVPDIYQDKIVWQDDRNGNYDIYMRTYNSITGELGPEIQVTNDPASQEQAAIYEDKIVWQDNRNGNWDIYMYDISTGQETQITADSGYQWYPTIYQDKIVWSDNRSGNWDVYMHDLSKGLEIRITDQSAFQGNPDVYQDKIVWYDQRHLYKSYFYMGRVYYNLLPLPPQLAPSNLQATLPSFTQVDLSWQDNSYNEDGFKIERYQVFPFETEFAEIAEVDANTTTFTDTSLESPGKYLYRVYAYNEHGNSDYSNEVLVTKVNHPPVLYPIDPQTVREGELLKFNLSDYAYDPDGDELTYEIVTIPPEGAEIIDPSTGEFSWQTNYNQAGMHFFVFVVRDPYGAADGYGTYIRVIDVP